MKIALINAPYYNKNFMENIGFVEHYLRILPPLGLMYVASIIKNSGHECILIDAVAEGLSKQRVLKILKKYNPQLVGFSLIVPVRSEIFEWARYIKEKLKVKIIFGGYATLYYPEEIVSNDFIDYVIIGSATNSLPKLIEAIDNDGEIENIEGIAFKKEGKIIVNFPKKFEDINSLPFPDRRSVNHRLYYSIISKNTPYSIMITSSGCIYKCDFCPMGKFPYIERDASKVVEEMEECHKMGIKEIDIFDDNFLFNRERVKKICEEIIKKGIKIEWTCRARVDYGDYETLKLMKKAGCKAIFYGIETGNEEIMKREHKGISKDMVRNAIEITKKAGIKTMGFFIIGHERESKESIKETIEFALELPLDYAQFFHMVVKPGTKLYEEVKKKIGFDYFRENLKANISKKIPITWNNLKEKEIKKWITRAYFSFYMRKGYIANLFNIVKIFLRKIFIKIKYSRRLWDRIKPDPGLIDCATH